ncbi:MAG: M48 family metallopeptidase [Saprospiraceae bacterium]
MINLHKARNNYNCFGLCGVSQALLMPRQFTYHLKLTFDNLEIPLKVVAEPRRSVRYYIGKTGGILRLPALMSVAEREKEVEKYKLWLAKHLRAKDQLKAHYEGKTYFDGDSLKVGERTYLIRIQESANKNYKGVIKEGVINLVMAANGTPESRSKAIRHLLSRLVARDYYPWVAERVAVLNEKHFNQPYNKISLKYNLSNWGSCSSKRNINLSTRLLFAPHDVVDYVIIHELAHLIEMNHSHRFWALVEKAMPDYKDKIAWLKKNWASCNF